ncbi:Spy/CpxP family protein refolding chaperone [Halonatronum saccharophilum]|uniref:Spy/CpxP family protein refolding chaperone n=1 Tax=Halonatronum saccharophilum TaxID=150060 RepID=UPI0004B75091|nr:periplasmic heavy metal sensor [Halonatronum saccharophilum]
MKKVLSLVLVGFLVLGLANIGFAHSMMGRRESVRGEGSSYHRNLDLSTEQIDQIKRLEDEYYRNRRDLMEELRDKNYDLRRLYEDKSVDSKEIKRLEDEVIELRNELTRLRRDYDLEVRELLLEDQLREYSRYGRGMDEADCYGARGSSFRGRGHMRGMMGY